MQHLQRTAISVLRKKERKKKKSRKCRSRGCKLGLKQGVTSGHIVECIVKRQRYTLIVLLEETKEYPGQHKSRLSASQYNICFHNYYRFHNYYFHNCFYFTNLSNLCPYCPKTPASKWKNSANTDFLSCHP